MSVPVHFEGVATYGRPRSVFGCTTVYACVALHHLEVVAVHVYGVGARIVVVDDDLHYIVVSHDVSVCVFAVDGAVGGVFSDA